MRLIGVCLRNLGSRPLRSALTALGIGVAVASFIALIGTSRGFDEAWRRSITERGSHLLVVRKGAVELLTASIDGSVGAQLSRVEGVEAAAGQLVNLVAVGADQTIVAKGWERTGYLWRGVQLTVGAMPGPDQPRGVVLGDVVAEALGKAVGDTLRIEERDFTVTGIANYAGALNRSALLMPLGTMQEIMDRPGKVTVFDLRVNYPDHAEWVAALKERLARQFPNLRFYETREVSDNNHLFRLWCALAWGISAIALSMGALVILNTLVMSVAERTYDIGVLSAIGWPSVRILSMILMEGILLAVLGSALGVALGVGGLELLTHVPRIRGFLEPRVTLRLLVDVSGAALLMGLVGSLYPAWRAVRLKPVDALRHE